MQTSLHLGKGQAVKTLGFIQEPSVENRNIMGTAFGSVPEQERKMQIRVTSGEVIKGLKQEVGT